MVRDYLVRYAVVRDDVTAPSIYQAFMQLSTT